MASRSQAKTAIYSQHVSWASNLQDIEDAVRWFWAEGLATGHDDMTTGCGGTTDMPAGRGIMANVCIPDCMGGGGGSLGSSGAGPTKKYIHYNVNQRSVSNYSAFYSTEFMFNCS